MDAAGLIKRYGPRTAVDRVSFTVPDGAVVGLLGGNGAGKSTVLRILLGLVRPDAGFVRLFGRDPRADGVAALGGVAGFVEAPSFYPYLSGLANLRMAADLDGGRARERIAPALEIVGLTERAGDRVGSYSHGMRQRLGIAAALLREPRLLVLDEPANGLDPAGMRDMRALIRRLAADQITVLLSSHLMVEVQELCDRVVILASGRVVRDAPLDELLEQTGARVRLATTDDQRAARIAIGRPGITAVEAAETGMTLTAGPAATAALSIALGAHGIGIAELRPATLEDVFLELTDVPG